MADEIKTIDVTEYENHADTDHILVDVRETDEYAGGHLPGAVNIPLSTFSEGYTQIPTDKPVMIVCERGGRSMQAAQFLAMQDDYNDIYNLDGGTSGWREAGKPVE
ncbi:MAG: rhodanese-like domain-containing protein [Chloroflexota bacterium]